MKYYICFTNMGVDVCYISKLFFRNINGVGVKGPYLMMEIFLFVVRA